MLYPMAICWDARYQCPETLKRFFSFRKHGTSVTEEQNLKKTLSPWISLQGECWLQEEKLFMGDIHEVENSKGTSFWNGGKYSESTVPLLTTQKIWTPRNTEWAHNHVRKSLQGRGKQGHAASTSHVIAWWPPGWVQERCIQCLALLHKNWLGTYFTISQNS